MNHQSSERIYLTFDYIHATPGGQTLLTGIKQCDETFYISGFYNTPNGHTDAFVYIGDITGRDEKNWHSLNFPNPGPSGGVFVTNLYGPAILKHGKIRVVGNYFTEVGAVGCMYTGLPDESTSFENWISLIPNPDAINVIAHSTMGDLAVGNYDTSTKPESQATLGKAFIYDVERKSYTEIIKPNAVSITAYGVWHNSGDCYTIAGGFSNLDPSSGLDSGYLVDYNNKTHKFTNWREYSYNNAAASFVTHFDGISSDNNGGYYLTGVAANRLTPDAHPIAFLAHTKGKHLPKWKEIKFPGSKITSGNSVAGTTVIGVYKDTTGLGSTTHGYISIII